MAIDTFSRLELDFKQPNMKVYAAYYRFSRQTSTYGLGSNAINSVQPRGDFGEQWLFIP